MRVAIYDLDTGENYVATSTDDCKTAADKSAFEEAERLKDAVTMGKVVAVPESLDTN